MVDASSVVVEDEPREPDFFEVRDFFDDEDDGKPSAGAVVAAESPDVVVVESVVAPVASVAVESELVEEEPDERGFFVVRVFFVEDDFEVFSDLSLGVVDVVLEDESEVPAAPEPSAGVVVPALVGSESGVAGADELDEVADDLSGELAESAEVVDPDEDDEVDEPDDVVETEEDDALDSEEAEEPAGVDGVPGSGVAVFGAGVPILEKKSLRKSPDLAGAAVPASAVPAVLWELVVEPVELLAVPSADGLFAGVVLLLPVFDAPV